MPRTSPTESFTVLVDVTRPQTGARAANPRMDGSPGDCRSHRTAALRYEKLAVEAAAEQASRALGFAQGNRPEAAKRFQSGLGRWQGLAAPCDAALAWTLLAEAHLPQGDPDSGYSSSSSRTSFDRLGADRRRASQGTNRLHAAGRRSAGGPSHVRSGTSRRACASCSADLPRRT